ncbi:MAG TPA: FoF1 ATP synthase subunit a [Candidatus Andersenbacteria bacterium]|nr:FoF1 ATP synthase subunit a [Candidatus Andersenbacteria bacterium]
MTPIHISIASEKIFDIGSFPVTNSLLTSFLVSIGIIIVFASAGKRAQVNPMPGIVHAIEALVEVVLDFIDSVIGDRALSERLLPFIMTFFIFILVNNWIVLLPGISAIKIGDAQILRSGTADLNTTIALAIISVVVTQVYGIYNLGIISHLKKYFSLNPMKLYVGLLELISEITRLISFSFRLFGSVFAGEVLLIVIAAFLPVLGPLPFLLLEVLFGLVQAVVFAMLTLVFMKLAITQQHESSHST